MTVEPEKNIRKYDCAVSLDSMRYFFFLPSSKILGDNRNVQHIKIKARLLAAFTNRGYIVTYARVIFIAKYPSYRCYGVYGISIVHSNIKFDLF